MGTSGVLLDKDKIIKALQDNKGVIEWAAKAVPCDPTTIYLWLRRDPDVKDALEKARAERDIQLIDENRLLKEKAYKSANRLLDKNDCTMTIFTLKSLAGFTDNKKDENKTYTVNFVTQPWKDENDTNSSQVPV